MSELWLAFRWGLGVSCGSAFGLLLFCLLFTAVEVATGRDKRRKRQEELNQTATEQLILRNELTRETNAKIERAVGWLGEIAEKDRS
jgi:sensor domain CHASE-containing protein